MKKFLSEALPFEESASVDIIRVSAGVTVTVESKQQTWTKQSLPQRYSCVGCQVISDQALRSLCLKWHVRVRDSTLWRHCWQEATEFLCTKTSLLEWVEQPKNWPPNWPKKTGNALSDALLMSSFQNFAADAAKKKSALRVVFRNHASHGFD